MDAVDIGTTPCSYPDNPHSNGDISEKKDGVLRIEIDMENIETGDTSFQDEVDINGDTVMLAETTELQTDTGGVSDDDIEEQSPNDLRFIDECETPLLPTLENGEKDTDEMQSDLIATQTTHELVISSKRISTENIPVLDDTMNVMNKDYPGDFPVGDIGTTPCSYSDNPVGDRSDNTSVDNMTNSSLMSEFADEEPEIEHIEPNSEVTNDETNEPTDPSEMHSDVKHVDCTTNTTVEDENQLLFGEKQGNDSSMVSLSDETNDQKDESEMHSDVEHVEGLIDTTVEEQLISAEGEVADSTMDSVNDEMNENHTGDM